MYRLRFDVETKNVATYRLDGRVEATLRFDVETKNVATGAGTSGAGTGCGLM